MNVFVITPTGGRPEGIRLLARYLNEQTYDGPLTWVLCDDCDPETKVPAMRDGITVKVIRPVWRWRPGQNTQAKSILACLESVPDDAVVAVFEDDDCYLPEHLKTALLALSFPYSKMYGEKVARYYNIRTNRQKLIPGNHASLASTVLKGEAIEVLRAVCKVHQSMIDIRLWRADRLMGTLSESANVIGIKGVPGRGGIGIGHRDDFGKPDPGGKMLRKWIGGRADEYMAMRR